MKWFALLFLFSFTSFYATAQPNNTSKIIPGAERPAVYVPLLKGKRIALFANQTSIAGNTHLVDTLQKPGVNIKVIFGPEHGFSR